MAGATAQKADDCQLHAAHLAHIATKQIDACQAMSGKLQVEQQQVQQQLRTYSTRAKSIQSDMVSVHNLEQFVMDQAQDHSERAGKHGKVSVLYRTVADE